MRHVLLATAAALVLVMEIDRRLSRAPAKMYYASLRPFTALPNLLIAWDAPHPPILRAGDILPLFPGAARLREHHKVIREEALAARTAKLDSVFFNKITDEKWSGLVLKWYGPLTEESSQCPQTSALIESLPQVKLAMFSVLKPGAVFTPHTGPSRACLRYHLAVDAPGTADCAITVDGEPFVWNTGEDVMFDDTFVHSVRNDTDKTRIVLFLDVVRPVTWSSLAQKLLFAGGSWFAGK